MAGCESRTETVYIRLCTCMDACMQHGGICVHGKI